MISYGENCWKQPEISIFGSFLKNRVKQTSPNQFSQKRKFWDNEVTHLHTKFHEDLMISYGENCWKWPKIGSFDSFLKNRVKQTSPNQFGQKRKFLDNQETHLHTEFHEDLMISYGENRWKRLKIVIVDSFLKNWVKQTSPNQFCQIMHLEMHLHTKFH